MEDAIAAMGYPAGKTKTMPLDLSDVLDRSDPRVRIRTNLEIYWDRIAYTVDEGDAPTVETTAPLVAARLFSRGFSRRCARARTARTSSSTTTPSPDPLWADMAGRYTRFGDVRELLTVRRRPLRRS
jgi:hypothetical protein